MSTLSAAAKRYWWAKAIPNPRQKQENEYRIKFCFNTEYAANSANNEVVIDENIKPFFLPIILIILEAAIIKIAVPTIDNDIGNVERDLIGLILVPIIPLKKTVTGATENANALLANSNHTFYSYGHPNGEKQDKELAMGSHRGGGQEGTLAPWNLKSF